MNKEEILALAEKHAKGRCTEEEQRIVEAFYDALQSRAVTPAWDHDREQAARNRMLGNIMGQIGNTTHNNATNRSTEPTHHQKPVKEPPRRYLHQQAAQKQTQFNVMRIAAAILLLVCAGVGTWYFALQPNAAAQMAVVTTGEAQRKIVTLADGSRITLNAGSTLTYPETFSSQQRSVTLKGEAFFEVQKDPARPFTITTSNIATTVLGTSFNIRAYNEQVIDVAVVTGKVAVANTQDTTQKVILTPNNMAEYDASKGTLKSFEVPANQYANWRKSSVEFNLEPFSEIIEQLSRWYNVELNVTYRSNEQCLVKARYANDSLETVLKGMQTLVNFDYVFVNAKTLEITYNGCK